MKPSIVKSFLTFCGAMLLVTQPGASCVSDTSSDGNSYPQSDRYPSDSQHDRDEDPNYIPQRADIVREGRGDLSFTADADGTVYIQNLRREETIHSQRVHRGQAISVSPEENRVRVDDKTVSKSDIKRDDVHRIYLLRDRRFEDDRNDGNDRDDSHDSKPPRGVPSSAQLMASGKNKELAFSPSKTGAVYIYGVEDRKLVSRVEIRGGEKFVLSPGLSRTTINGKRVGDGSFDTRTTYRVYFNRED